MRSFVVTLIVLVVVIAGLLAIVPRFVDWNAYREQLTRQAGAITDSTVEIEGRISVRLLPSPTLSLARARLDSGTEDSVKVQLTVDRLDLRLRALPLLTGEIEIGDVRMVRPVLQIDRETRPERESSGPDNPLDPLIAIRPDRLTVVDGRAVFRQDDTAWQFGAIDVDLLAESPEGPLTLDGGFALANQAFEIDARFGRLSPDRVGTLQVDLAALGRRPTQLQYQGAAWWDSEMPRLRGELTVAGADVLSTVGAISTTLRRSSPPLPPWLERPFEVTGALELDHQRLQLDTLRLLLAGTEASGQFRLGFSELPQIELNLRAQQLALEDPLTAGAT
ncbi:MAG: AsmA family protein, partial [Pseudomonadota bacterium]